jgi:hypothetical protein
MSRSSLPCVPRVPIVCEIVPIPIGMDVVILFFQNNFEPIYKIFLCASNKHLVVMELVYSNAPNLH